MAEDCLKHRFIKKIYKNLLGGFLMAKDCTNRGGVHGGAGRKKRSHSPIIEWTYQKLESMRSVKWC